MPVTTPRLAVFRGLALGAVVASIVVPVLVLLGWTYDVVLLRSVLPGAPAMSPNSAVCFILLGVALWLLLPEPPGRPLRRALGRACAGAALVLGALTLLEYATGRPLGVDGFLFQGMQWAQRTPPPSPSANGAGCYTLLGAALLLLERPLRPRVPWTDVLVAPVLVSALLVCNGYLHGSLAQMDAPNLFAHTGMGLHSALLLLVLGNGILCARPQRGALGRLTRPTLGGMLARRLVPVALLAPMGVSALLKLLGTLGVLNAEAKLPLFSAITSAGSVAFVLLSAWGVDLIEAERQRETAAREKAEARYRALLETAGDPILTVDAGGTIRFVNTEVERVFGYTREELLGQPVELLVPERLRDLHREHRAGYAREPRLRRMGTEHRLVGRHKDGRELPIEVSLNPAFGPEGLSVTATVRDISERERFIANLHRAREEAEEQRVRLQTVLDSTPVGVFVVEPDTDAVFANATLQSIFGITTHPEEGRRQFLPHLRHPDGRPVRLEELPSTRSLKGETTPLEEFLVMRPDGRVVPILSSSAPIPGPGGEVRGVVVTCQDITARRELERLQEEYLGLVSHDLRNPLNNIVLRVQLLQRSLREKGLARELATAEALEQSAKRMGGMIEELLESTRLESRRVELHREPVDVVHFLEGVLERDVPPAERERFRLEVVGTVPPVPADAARLERVVANLLSNTLKYTPPGTPVTVRVTREDGRAVVAVRDAGPGLPPEETSHLFEKYYRTHSGKKKSEGTGLGLYISRLIVEAHGGRIWVESVPGQGSTFSFSLPLDVPGDEARAQGEEAPPPAGA